MLKLIEVDKDSEGLKGLIGEKVTLLCANYFYAGKLVGVNDSYVKLENASIVYETGAWDTKTYKDVQKLPGKAIYVMTSFIESFGVLK
jgi:hypothetical protein